jgi:hypothetical protein
MSRHQNTPEEFARQLKEGHYNELRVALHFMLKKCLTRITFVAGRYDIEVLQPAGKLFHVEVKWDKRASGTGNLYFEIENTRQRRPSGIAATTADRWCHVLGDGHEAIFIDTPKLRSLLRAGRFKSVSTSGLDSNSRGLLVPRPFLEASKDVDFVELPTVEGFFGEVFGRGATASWSARR